MKYLIIRVNYDGTIVHDLFDNEFIAKDFQKKNNGKVYQTIMIVVCPFRLDEDLYYYSQNDEGDICIVSDKFEYITEFKPKNKCIELIEIVKVLEKSLQEEDRQKMH